MKAKEKKDKLINLYRCPDCGYLINEKLDFCPICNTKLQKEKGKKVTYNSSLPEVMKKDEKRPFTITYYCYACHKIIETKVCSICNTLAYLCINYHGKKALINKMDSLYDIFDPSEVEVIAKGLTKEEKDLIYHNFRSSPRFFYRKDTNKASVCLIIGIAIYALCLWVSTQNMTISNIVIAYITNVFGNSLAFIFLTMSIWYYFDAYSVEYKNVSTTLGILTAITGIIYLLLALLNNWNFQETLIYGAIHMGITIIIYIFILIIKGKKR